MVQVIISGHGQVQGVGQHRKVQKIRPARRQANKAGPKTWPESPNIMTASHENQVLKKGLAMLIQWH
jgi:hypothetical protein